MGGEEKRTAPVARGVGGWAVVAEETLHQTETAAERLWGGQTVAKKEIFSVKMHKIFLFLII